MNGPTGRAAGWIWAAAVSAATVVAAAEPRRADVVVYGGSAGGVISAVAAAREGKSVLLLSENNHVGGLVSGGLGGTDIGRSETIGGYSREFFDRCRKYYVDKYGEGSPQVKAAGTHGYQFEPHVAELIFRKMLEEAKVTLLLGQRLAKIDKNGADIASITTKTGEVFAAAVFIDASYEGDLMAAAGVKYHVGREGREVYGESIAGVQAYSPAHQFPKGLDVPALDAQGNPLPLVQPGPLAAPGTGDRKVQAYNFRLCLTKIPENRIPFPKPEGYDPARYEILKQYLAKKPDIRPLSFFNNRTMPNGKTDTNNNGPISSDHIGANWDYPEGDEATRRRIWDDHIRYHQGLLYFLANDPSVPEHVRKEMSEWGLAKDEFADTNHWPHQLYVREARRMIGEFVMTEKDILAKGDVKNLTKPDSVCLGSYNTDSHHVQRVPDKDGYLINEGDFQIRITPYAIAYRSLTPKAGECTNLLVPVCCSASHVAYCTIRMEPVYMMLGQASGVAAAMAADAKTAVQKVPVDALQEKLKAQKAILDPLPFQGGGGTRPAANARLDLSRLPAGAVVVDDEAATRTGEWAGSSSTPGFVGGGYLHDGNADKGRKTVRYPAKLPKAGRYEVRIAYTAFTNRAANVPVVIRSKDGEKTVKVDQRHVMPEGKPVLLGTFEFDAEGGWVEIRTDGTDGHVIADAVVFVPVP